jgi:hypothetical protein
MKVDETLSRMTLDIIGEGVYLKFVSWVLDLCLSITVAFDYRFGVLSDNGVDNEFVQAFNNLLYVSQF